MNIFREIISSCAEEIAAMRSGRFMPYHKISLAIAVIVTALFSVIFSHGSVFEGRISVIDLDGTSTSVNLITNVNASSYISVREVRRHPANVTKLTAHDRVLGVLLIPQDFAKSLQTGSPVHLRYYADYSNEAQNAEILENLNVIAAQYGAQVIMQESSAAHGISAQQASVLMQPLSVEVRRLFNPTFSSTNSTVSAFLIFFSSLYLGITVLMIPGRLHVTGQWNRVILEGSPIGLMARIIPYAFFFTTAIMMLFAVLTCCGQMRFAGSAILFAIALFMCALAVGFIGLLYAWNTQDPGQGASFMILLIPPGFIVGGATMAVGVIPETAFLLSHFFPLVWVYHFQRDLVLRGIDLFGMLDLFGALFIYLALLGLIICVRFTRAKQKMLQPKPPLLADADISKTA